MLFYSLHDNIIIISFINVKSHNIITYVMVMLLYPLCCNTLIDVIYSLLKYHYIVVY